MELIAQYASRVLNYLQTIKITDVVDMVIMTYVIYRLLLFTRKSQSGQVVKGIVVVLLALWVTDTFQLHVLHFILSNAVEIGFLALIVVFQPEIRRFLEQVGTKGFSKIIGHQTKTNQMENAIVQTVEAFGSMSRDRIGALVVFERDNMLDDVIKSGTKVDATVSSELLKNIFLPKAPLHDGAVVIRHGRVQSAACVLPLTGNLNISRDLGTRHRAGIGISEHSDAVVAIVSEETGSISVAVGGMLKRHLSLETLERLLRNELITADGESDGKRSLFDLLRRMKGGKDHVE